jgi:hypothetical protein
MKLKIFGIILILVLMFTVTAMADSHIYLEPSEITCNQGEVTDITIYMDSTDDVTYFQLQLKYTEDEDIDIVNITSSIEGTNPDWIMWDSYWKNGSSDIPNIGYNYLFITATLLSSSVTGEKIELAKISVEGLSPGEMPLDILIEEDVTMKGDPTEMGTVEGIKLPFTHTDGTFTCIGEAPTEEPTEAPTEEPTEAPTEEPTKAPTEEPTKAPTEEPTEIPEFSTIVIPVIGILGLMLLLSRRK